MVEWGFIILLFSLLSCIFEISHWRKHGWTVHIYSLKYTFCSESDTGMPKKERGPKSLGTNLGPNCGYNACLEKLFNLHKFQSQTAFLDWRDKKYNIQYLKQTCKCNSFKSIHLKWGVYSISQVNYLRCLHGIPGAGLKKKYHPELYACACTCVTTAETISVCKWKELLRTTWAHTQKWLHV